MAAVRFTILSELLSSTNHQSPWRDKQRKTLTDDVKGVKGMSSNLMSKTQRFRDSADSAGRTKNQTSKAFDLTPDLQNRSQMVWRETDLGRRAILGRFTVEQKGAQTHFDLLFDIAYQAGSAGKTSLQVSDGPMVYCRLSNK